LHIHAICNIRSTLHKASPCIAQELQDEFVDLVPNHRTDGDSVEKFFQRTSPLMTVAQSAP
jgi:hypothetical protein